MLTTARPSRPARRRSKTKPTVSDAHPDALPAAAAPGAPLRGRLRAPGDKSISHRALIFGLLSIGETRIEGLLEGDDVLRTAAACRALGAAVSRDAPGRWRGRGAGIRGPAQPPEGLDSGNTRPRPPAVGG